jgi:hypothetical protein
LDTPSPFGPTAIESILGVWDNLRPGGDVASEFVVLVMVLLVLFGLMHPKPIFSGGDGILPETDAQSVDLFNVVVKGSAHYRLFGLPIESNYPDLHPSIPLAFIHRAPTYFILMFPQKLPTFHILQRIKIIS